MFFVGFESKNVDLKIPIIFLFTFWLISKQTADQQKNVEGIEWRAINDLRFGVRRISVPSTVTKLQGNMCFVNKQLYIYIKSHCLQKLKAASEPACISSSFEILGVKISAAFFELEDKNHFQCPLEFHSTVVVRNTAHSAYT